MDPAAAGLDAAERELLDALARLRLAAVRAGVDIRVEVPADLRDLLCCLGLDGLLAPAAPP